MASSLAVRKITEELVAPCEPTPCETFPLSSIDRALGMAFMLEMVSVYPSNNCKQRDDGASSSAAAKAIRGALARALVPYYPVAGRLVSSGGDRVEVACSGEGVWFVEAAVTDRGLSAMSDWEAIPRRVVKEELLPNSPAHLNQQEMILMMQVTHFPCGGFVVGIKFNHLVFDGIGIGLFLKAISEIACGCLTHPSVDPIWRRDTIPAPLVLSNSLPAVFGTMHDVVNTKYDFSIQNIKRLKKEIEIEASNRFTTFEVVAAILWKCRTQAISHIGDACLIIMANIRHLLWPLPNAGYYGNCIYEVRVTATSERIVKASLAELVGLIRDAKEGLSTKFKEWISGNFTEDPYKVSIDYNNLMLSDLKWLEFYEANYGWGIPHYVSPLNDLNFICGFLLKQPLPEEGVRFEGRVVMKEHEQRFIDEIKRCINV